MPELQKRALWSRTCSVHLPDRSNSSNQRSGEPCIHTGRDTKYLAPCPSHPRSNGSARRVFRSNEGATSCCSGGPCRDREAAIHFPLRQTQKPTQRPALQLKYRAGASDNWGKAAAYLGRSFSLTGELAGSCPAGWFGFLARPFGRLLSHLPSRI